MCRAVTVSHILWIFHRSTNPLGVMTEGKGVAKGEKYRVDKTDGVNRLHKHLFKYPNIA